MALPAGHLRTARGQGLRGRCAAYERSSSTVRTGSSCPYRARRGGAGGVGEARRQSRIHELIVRGPGYGHHVEHQLQGLFAPITDDLLRLVGFSIDEIQAAFWSILTITDRKLESIASEANAVFEYRRQLRIHVTKNWNPSDSEFGRGAGRARLDAESRSGLPTERSRVGVDTRLVRGTSHSLSSVLLPQARHTTLFRRQALSSPRPTQITACRSGGRHIPRPHDPAPAVGCKTAA